MRRTLYDIVMSQVRNPSHAIVAIMYRLSWLFRDDARYIKIIYWLEFHCRLNIHNPISFNEKLQWLKLYNRNPEYSRMVDKFAVKDYVAKTIGEEYVIPTIGKWDKPLDIEWNQLPNQFVLKTNHDGGGNGVIICKDKASGNIHNIECKLYKSLKRDLYSRTREWPYKNVQKCIFAEPLLQDNIQEELLDYKFFCFNGKAQFYKIDFNRATFHRANYYSINGNLLNMGECMCPPDNHKELKIPTNMEKMIQIAEILSANIPFVRVDLYNVKGKIYFSELTFFPASGFGRWLDDKTDIEIGKFLLLPKNKIICN